MKQRLQPFLIAGFLLTLLHAFYGSTALSKDFSEEEQSIQVGIGAFRDGFYDLAERQFSNFAGRFPNHSKLNDVLYLLAKTYLAQEKWKEAKALLQRLILESRGGDSADFLLFWAAQTEMKLGNPDGARKWLLLLTRNYPRFQYADYANFHLGCVELEANRQDLAQSCFERTLSLSKQERLLDVTAFWLGLVSVKQGKYDRAVFYLKPLSDDPKRLPGRKRETLFWLAEAERKLGNIPGALRIYQLLYDQFRGDPLISQVYWWIGFCEYLLGNRKDSVDRLRSFQSLFKDSPLVFHAHFLLAEIFSKMGDYVSSSRELNQILQSPQPHALWPAALLMLYWDLLQLNETAETQRVAQRLLKLQAAEDEKSLLQWLMAQNLFAQGKVVDALPYYFAVLNSRFRQKALLQIGKGYFLENQYREALTNVDLLVLEFPNMDALDQALLLNGESLSRLGEGTRAMEAYSQAARKGGRSPWAFMALTEMGSHYLTSGQWDKAEQPLAKITEVPSIHPLFYHAAFQLGILAEKKKDLPGASRYFAIVLRGAPAELLGPTYFRIGEILIEQGKPDKALSSFSAALPHFPHDSIWFGIAQLEIGNVQRSLGRYREARTAYETAQNRAKDQEVSAAARESLKTLADRSW